MIKDFSFGIIPLQIMENDWYVLLVQQHEGYWAFPKGGKEQDELPLESAIRELNEETGLRVKEIISEEPLIEMYTFFRRKVKIEKTVSYFIALTEGDLKLQEEEILAAKWVKLVSAVQELTFPEGKALCKKVVEIIRPQQC